MSTNIKLLSPCSTTSVRLVKLAAKLVRQYESEPLGDEPKCKLLLPRTSSSANAGSAANLTPASCPDNVCMAAPVANYSTHWSNSKNTAATDVTSRTRDSFIGSCSPSTHSMKIVHPPQKMLCSTRARMRHQSQSVTTNVWSIRQFNWNDSLIT